MENGYRVLGVPVDVSIWTLMAIITVLVVLAGLMAGLIISIFSLDTVRLKALACRSETVEGRRARRLLLILHNPNWVLVTLVVVDSAATEMLPLLLNVLLSPAEAVIVSVILLVVFGEIIPEAVFTHHALALGSALAYLVLVLMIVTAPVSWPVGKMLDWCVGNRSGVAFKRGQLREVIRYRAAQLDNIYGDDDEEAVPLRDSDLDTREPYLMHQLETQIMLGVLSLSEYVGSSVLKKSIRATFTVHRDAVVSKRMVQSMVAHKLTHIPVYSDVGNPSNVTQVFELRLLLFFAYCKEEVSIRIRDLPLLPLPRYSADTPCNLLLDYLRASPLQVAALMSSESAARVVGIISASDVVELVHKTSFDATYVESHGPQQGSVVQSFRAHNAFMTHETNQMILNEMNA
ncbi:conserved hypothetical protein [Leishmania braziliensis MHOM/BR/75/M2904]|uniref:CNNM transmembrane domain-containing protein n=2 Tax=Leishmania braziliensis TaxID=5660 RepID=A4HKU5_LEIBR|nr:conserved hypothetical protein [Leishmania braziliensis MHOM/BR/75/M2904]CAJ2478840.1 unnamed protein product [Leishmania braziliensis]CAJ2479240.1 unnamed protein product [Leishmania braziliensis]CAM43124.1 conserved hypothetical protein [Leishmania braziliensis MHOM/BR/75/M2904]SYZ68829.1 Domain_of_uncharacterised_function_DUF21 [Leishmania braziliensis MHOM/BR/75/M2904]